MQSIKTSHGPPHPAVDANATWSEKKSDEVFDAELSAQLAKRTDKLSDNTVELALRVKQAREFLAWSVNHIRGSWLDWMEQADKALKDVNMLRMALDRETKSIIAAGKDVRDFFNSKEYAESVTKMREMVDLLERFSKLKSDGVMDAFADFILKVCE